MATILTDFRFLPKPTWLVEAGPDNDVVISTRCRLARNIVSQPFPWRCKLDQLEQIDENITESARSLDGVEGDIVHLAQSKLTDEQCDRLLQWRYASLDWMAPSSSGCLLAWPSGGQSIMINEEDHLRFQAISPGLLVESTLRAVQNIERALAVRLQYAYDNRIGFLTTSLANAGNGLRIGVILHLPGLAASRKLKETLSAAREIGCAIRGIYGEGTPGTGEMYQVSNTYTFGISEQRTIERIISSVRYLIDIERQARNTMYGNVKCRRTLREAAITALSLIRTEDSQFDRLISLVSVLRLAVSEGLLRGEIQETNEWVALAGWDCGYNYLSASNKRDRAIRRSAALRGALTRF